MRDEQVRRYAVQHVLFGVGGRRPSALMPVRPGDIAMRDEQVRRYAVQHVLFGVGGRRPSALMPVRRRRHRDA